MTRQEEKDAHEIDQARRLAWMERDAVWVRSIRDLRRHLVSTVRSPAERAGVTFVCDEILRWMKEDRTEGAEDEE